MISTFNRHPRKSKLEVRRKSKINVFTEELIQKALSTPSSEDYKNFDCVGTYDEDILSKFVEKHREDKLNCKIDINPSGTYMLANYLILLFIDKDSCDFDIEEWRTFYEYCKEFEHIYLSQNHWNKHHHRS